MVAMKEPVINLPGPSAPTRLRFNPRGKSFWKQILAEDAGQDLIEYALLAALVGLGAVFSLKGLSNKIGNSFNSIGTTLSSY